MATRYRIEPYGVQSVVKSTASLAEHELNANAKAIQSAMESAEGHCDPASPVRGILAPFGLAAAGQLKDIMSTAGSVMTAAVNATNAYIEADVEMARHGKHGVTVTQSYVSGFDGDKAQHRAQQATGGLRNQPKLDAMDQRDRPSLSDWMAAVQGQKQ